MLGGKDKQQQLDGSSSSPGTELAAPPCPETPLQVLAASGSEDPKYPHPFELSVTVSLGDNSLTQKLAVTNTGGCCMQLPLLLAQL
jgi:hypothetical protein